MIHAGSFQDGVAARERGDYATALQLLRPLAEQGDANAQYDLGVMYGLGQRINQDYLRAHMWFNLAASTSSGDGRQRATRSRDRIGKSLTSAQVMRAAGPIKKDKYV